MKWFCTKRAGSWAAKSSPSPKVASRRDFENIIRYLRIQVRKLGVKVNLGREVNADDILRAGADSVVIATGAVPVRTG